MTTIATDTAAGPLAALIGQATEYAAKRAAQETARRAAEKRKLQELLQQERERITRKAITYVKNAFPTTLAARIPDEAWSGHAELTRNDSTAVAYLGGGAWAHYQPVGSGFMLVLPCYQCDTGYILLPVANDHGLLTQLADYSRSSLDDEAAAAGTGMCACDTTPHEPPF